MKLFSIKGQKKSLDIISHCGDHFELSSIAPIGTDTSSIDAFIRSSDAGTIEGLRQNTSKKTPVTLDIDDTSTIYNPPISNPNKIICTVNNYSNHADEMRNSVFPQPLFFLKSPTSLIGHNDTVLVPEKLERVDYELELALIIGRHARFVAPSDALSYVFGYSIFLDISIRDFMSLPHTWFGIKSWDTTGPLGPVVVTKDAIPDPQALSMRLLVNGEDRMNSHTSQMVASCADLVSAASEVVTLMPGDIIATGTIAGVGAVEPGDEIVGHIEGIGSLRVTMGVISNNLSFYGKDFPRIYDRQLKKFTGI